MCDKYDLMSNTATTPLLVVFQLERGAPVLHICPLAAIPRGEGLRIDTIEPPIAVFHTDDGDVFAIDDTCTHQDASLADGWLEGCEVECPLHASKFDLRTGKVDAPPAKRPVRVHQVTVTDNEIYVELSTLPAPEVH